MAVGAEESLNRDNGEANEALSVYQQDIHGWPAKHPLITVGAASTRSNWKSMGEVYAQQ